MYRLSNEFFAYNNRFNARGGWGTAVMTAGPLKCKARRTPLRVTWYLAPPHNRLAKKKILRRTSSGYESQKVSPGKRREPPEY